MAIEKFINYEGHTIILHTGTKRINRSRWWYKILGENKRFVFSAFDQAGAVEALQKAKAEIDGWPNDFFVECWVCGVDGWGKSFTPPAGWDIVSGERGPQYVCPDCLQPSTERKEN